MSADKAGILYLTVGELFGCSGCLQMAPEHDSHFVTSRPIEPAVAMNDYGYNSGVLISKRE